MNYFSHETALVDEGAKIGRNSKVWHFSHICGGAIIGEDVTIGQNVYVGNDVEIGNRCKIQNNISIYDKVVIKDDVFCGPSVVFTNVKNPRAFVIRKSEYKETIVQTGSSLGANCTIICGVSIGEYSFIAAGSVVTKDVEPYSLVAGVPAKHVGWITKYGEKIPKESEKKGFICSVYNEKYFVIDNKIKVEKL